MQVKMLIEFIGLIIRQRFYNLLKNEMRKLPVKHNYMTVPAPLRELEKIELSRVNAGIFRQDHAVSKTQKTILRAFAMTEEDARNEATRISVILAANRDRAEEIESGNDEEDYDAEA